jgi:predicted lysophospholipase L1 biosynthesis ABC-type transport system permease subunit
MVSMDLSHYLNVKEQNDSRCDGAHSQPYRRDKVVASRRKFRASLRVSRVNNDANKESRLCLSFRQASTLAIVVFLLSNVLLDATVACLLIGSAASTFSMAIQLRAETLQRREQRATLKQSSLELRFAIRELERAESDFMRSMPRVSFEMEKELDESCS